ncbi:hypothetical protein QBC35DRAFT_487933 [Podospora australis]|uniref:Lysine-specific metallo-endopeptidase domain-containing protein n=1 Tax=Podospora australis TaxID=1536484 RepID=A0AAN6X3B7_9PEZI|nr:hypothetical protein QBC35DRAFT_487933 [Podospora australis]
MRPTSLLAALGLSLTVSAGPLSLPKRSLPAHPSTARNITSLNKPSILRRGEPSTGDDFPDDPPFPNNLNKVETAFNDALELTSYVLFKIDSDNDVFPHYFDPADKAEVKRIFETINNGDQGNDMLNNVLIQLDDPENLCDDTDAVTLAYMGNSESDNPFITLCPKAFNKKAVTILEHKDINDPDANQFYAKCRADGGDIGGNVNYHMNTLGMTLLHEYLHFDKMIASSFGSIIDHGRAGYGAVGVYDSLPKDQARTNADSYAYYASHLLWSVLCIGETFDAPRPGIDDADPDCGASACEP